MIGNQQRMGKVNFRGIFVSITLKNLPEGTKWSLNYKDVSTQREVLTDKKLFKILAGRH